MKGLPKSKDTWKKVIRYAQEGHLKELTNQLLEDTGDDVLNEEDEQDNYTPLMWAAKNGHNDVIIKLLAHLKKKDVDKQGGWNGSTALIKAAEVNNLEGCQLLVDKGADFNLYTDYKTTALMIAAERGFLDVVNVLIAKGADVTLRNKDLFTALVLAVEAGHTEVVKSLCNHGVKNIVDVELNDENIHKLKWNKSNRFAFVNIPNKFGKNALIMACENNHLECARMLLEDFKANVDAYSHRGMTCLMMAIIKGHVDIVELLLENKADIHLANMDGTCAITVAFNCKKPEIPKMLLERGASKTHVFKGGVSVLMKAAEKGKLESVKALFEVYTPKSAGPMANPCYLPSHSSLRCMGCSKPFSSTLGKYHCSVCGELLCKRCCLPVESLDQFRCVAEMKTYLNYGTTRIPEKRVCDRCKEGSPREFKEYVNLQCEAGNTALHYAIKNGHFEVYFFLVDKSADPKIKNNENETAFDLLTQFFCANQLKFKDTYVKAIVEGKLGDKNQSRVELLKLFPKILSEFRSPKAVLDNVFDELISGIKKQSDGDLVNCLVQVATATKNAMVSHPLEATYMQDKYQNVMDAINKCFNLKVMNSEDNVIKILGGRGITDNMSKVMSRAMCFKVEPLETCFEHEFLPIFGTRQLSLLADEVFFSCLREQQFRTIIDIADIFQMRSNLVSLRTCPFAMFCFEGFFKFVMFLLVTAACSEGESGFYAGFIQIFLVTTIFHEIGEFYETGWSLKDYFKDVWNYLDTMVIALFALWTAIRSYERLSSNGLDQCVDSGMQEFVCTRSSSDLMPDKELLAVAVIPLALSLLRYLTMNKDLGQYVLIAFSMMADLRVFACVYMIFVIGFGIAFHSLFSSKAENYGSASNVVKTMFSASLGDFELADFSNHTDSYKFVGEILMICFVTIANVVLVNLVVARMSSTHDDLSTDALSRWCMMKVSNVEEYLLIKERNPLSMLPAPLNLFSTVLYPFHLFIIHTTNEKFDTLTKQAKKKKSNEVDKKTDDSPHPEDTINLTSDLKDEQSWKCISLCGTVADFITCIFFICPCAFYEVWLCLKCLRSQKTNSKVFWICVFIAVVFFPLVYVAFMLVLIREIFGARSILKVDEEGEIIIDYGQSKEITLQTKNTILETGKRYVGLEVTLLRTGFSSKSYFTDPTIYAVVEFESNCEERLVTKPLSPVVGLYFFSEEKKKFIFLADKNAKALKLKVSLVMDGSNETLGVCTCEVKDWIANGRFEGDLVLHKPGTQKKVGTINITAKKMNPTQNEWIQIIEDRQASKSVSPQLDDVGIFSNDINTIFENLSDEENDEVTLKGLEAELKRSMELIMKSTDTIPNIKEMLGRCLDGDGPEAAVGRLKKQMSRFANDLVVDDEQNEESS